jgi:hypothetical protein
MKAVKKSLFVIIPLMFTSLAYAGSKSFDVKFTSEQFAKESAFNCFTDAVPSLLNSVTVTIVSDSQLKMIGGDLISDKAISTDFLAKYYFQATNKPSDNAHVKVTLTGDKINENTVLTCDFGHGGKQLYK